MVQEINPDLLFKAMGKQPDSEQMLEEWVNYKNAKGNLTFSLNYNYEDLEVAANLPSVQLVFKEVNKTCIMSLLHFKVQAFTYEEFKIWHVFFL